MSLRESYGKMNDQSTFPAVKSNPDYFVFGLGALSLVTTVSVTLFLLHKHHAMQMMIFIPAVNHKAATRPPRLLNTNPPMSEPMNRDVIHANRRICFFWLTAKSHLVALSLQHLRVLKASPTRSWYNVLSTIVGSSLTNKTRLRHTCPADSNASIPIPRRSR